jgi:hypothetical protein
MNVEQLEDLVKELRRATKSDVPAHWAYVSKGQDGKPVFVVRRKEPELTKELNDSRRDAQDKVYAKGQTVVTEGALAFGVDEGAATPANIKRDLLLLKKEPALAKIKDTLGAEVLVGEAWDAVKPDPRRAASLRSKDDEMGDLGGGNAKTKGGTIKKTGSDFDKLVKALDDWRDDVRGQEMTTDRVNEAAKDLKAIEVLVDTWEQNHEKSVFDSKKTKDRRTAVADIRKNISTARTFLDQALLIAQVGAFVDTLEDEGDAWDTTYRPLAEGQIAQARKALEPLQKKALLAVNKLDAIEAPAPRKKWVVDRLASLDEELKDRTAHVDDHAMAFPLVENTEKLAKECVEKWKAPTSKDIDEALKDVRATFKTVDEARAKLRQCTPAVAEWGIQRLEPLQSPLSRLNELAAVYWDEDHLKPFEVEVAKLLKALPVELPGKAAATQEVERLEKLQSTLMGVYRSRHSGRDGHRGMMRTRLETAAVSLTYATNVIALAPLLAEVDSIAGLLESWHLAFDKTLDGDHVESAGEQVEKMTADAEKARDDLDSARDASIAVAWSRKLDGILEDLRGARDHVTLVKVRGNVGALDPSVSGLAQPILAAIDSWDTSFGTFKLEDAGLARGALEAIDVQIGKARAALVRNPPSPKDLKAIEASLDELTRESGRRRTRLDVNVSATPPSEEELRQFAEGEKSSRDKALQEEGVERGTWSKKVQGGLDDGSYKVGKQIGKGGFGTVYLLKGGKDAPLLACKTANEDELSHEAEIYAKLPPHPNVVRSEGIREIEVDGKKVKVLVMQALTGGNMEDLMDKGKKALESKTVSHLNYWGAIQYMARSMVRALQHLDSQGLAHNDIKPENMMLDEETGELKLVDMGTVIDREAYQKFGSSGYLGLGKGEKRDAFAVGASVYQGGQQLGREGGAKDSRFDYDGAVYTSAGGAEYQAVEWTKKAVKALRKNPPKEGAKGTIGVASAYSDWVNRMMDQDVKTRMSFAESLKHPFLADIVVDDDTAKKTLKVLALS